MSLTFYAVAVSLFTLAITRCINNYLLKSLEGNRSLLVNQHTRRWFMCFHGLCLRLASLEHDHDVPQIFHDVFCRPTNSIVYLCFSNWVSEFEKLVIKLLKHAYNTCLLTRCNKEIYRIQPCFISIHGRLPAESTKINGFYIKLPVMSPRINKTKSLSIHILIMWK